VNYNSNPQSIAAGMDNFVTHFHPANTHVLLMQSTQTNLSMHWLSVLFTPIKVFVYL